MTMDRYRPSYHFTPPHNWMNDPNGPFQLGGEYHLFYQHNPSAPQWGTIHWGHAKSTDLVNWTHLPVALAPSNELGESHCYSGCSVVNGDEVKLFYTSIGEGERNATSGAQQWTAGAGAGDLLTWRKPGDANPALTSELHGETRITEWRDPYVWKQQDGWRMLLGGIEGEKGCGMIYSSDDLENWSYKGIFYKGEEWIWECPHLFRFDDDQAVLFYSPSGPVRYVSGTIREDRLTDVKKHGTVDGGGWEGYYASTGFVDENGRRIMLGWAPEGRGDNFPVSLDWAGTLALPRVVELKPNGALAMAPVPELEKLRGDSRSFAKLNIGQTPKDMGFRSTACEIAVDVDRRTLEDGDLVVALFASSCGRERTEVRLDLAANTVVIDRVQSSLFPNVNKSPIEAKLPAADGAETLRLRIFADQSIVEVFADDETCLTARVYPSLEDSNGIELRSSGSSAVCDVKVWEMKAAKLQ